ncbi:hypothetical protein V7S43_004790 [Phytophthora oleae]|uniref:ABC transmembrane type-1 domain-containing protein n=1 Tax=Phytophthora oleae TaxID=2107226 RepID=A0ABD3FVX9_9STRA
MQPLLLLGAICGTFLNTIIPTWLLSVMLVFVLSVTGTRTLQKAISVRQNEHWQCGVLPESESLLGIESLTLDTMNLLQGGKHFESPLGIDSSSPVYTVLVVIPCVVLIVASYVSLKTLGAIYERQQNPGYEFEAHEIR